MADAVSKLYAEIGFKVNQDGLKQLQSIVKDVANQMNAINKATKEAAKSFGIFSKEQSKQAIADEKRGREEIKSERERIKNKMVIRNQEFKEQMAIRKAEFAERLKEDRERERLARKEQHRNERTNRERKKALNEALHATGNFVKSIGNYLKVGAAGFGRLLYSGVNESLGRSIATRDFMLATGANLGDIQSVMARFANIGESVNQEQVMGDLIKLSQGIAGIALGQGDADTYKLLGQAAQRGDIAGMIKGIGRSGNYIDNDMFMKLLGNIGLPSYWLPFFKAQGAGIDVGNFIDEEGRGKIEVAQANLTSLSLSFKNLADWVASVLSPAIEEVSRSFIQWNKDMVESLKGEGGERLSELLRQISKDLMEWLKVISPDRIYTGIKTFIGAITYLSGWLVGIARKLGYRTDEEKEEYLRNFSEKIRGRMIGGDTQDWMIYKEALKIGYRPSGSGVNIIDNRNIVSNVTVKDEEVVDAVQGEAIKFGALNIDRSAINAFVSGNIGSGR